MPDHSTSDRYEVEKLRTRIFASRLSGITCSILLGVLVVGVDSADRFLDEARFQPGERSPVSIRLPSTGYLRSSPAARVKVQFEHERFVLRKGEIVPDRAAEKYKLLQSTLERRHELRHYRMVGVFLVTFLLGQLLSGALRRTWPGNRRYLRTEITIYVLIALLALAAKPMFVLTSLPVYLVPAAAGPIIIAYFRGRRLCVYTSLCTAFVLSLMLDLDAVAFVVFLVQGLSVIPFLRPSRKIRPIFSAGGISTVAGLVALFGLSIALTGSAEIVGITDWSNSVVLAVIVGGLASGPVAWGLALAFRPLLGIVSQSALNDLQQVNHPLLKRLHEQAPGTWEHSRAIANLAEEAASRIEVDALLVRVGAYFHDMGKAINPHLFVENQEVDDAGKLVSPHDDMQPEKSASLIVDHVIQGVQILRNNGIPEAVVEFAYMHHGSSVVEYFWNKYREECKDKGIKKPELTRDAFTYPGIPPQSPEAGIMMLADSVEATSRTVTEPTIENFKTMVNRIIFSKLADGQLDECGLVVKDLKEVARTFAESLHFSRHKRVKYQWQVREEAEAKRLKQEEEAIRAARPSVPPLAPPPDEGNGGAVATPSVPPAPVLSSQDPDSEISVEVQVGPPPGPEGGERKRTITHPDGLAAGKDDGAPPAGGAKPPEPDGEGVRKAKTNTLTGVGPAPETDEKPGS
jgi:putative nucleotidyltransferase with HDIG domain